MSYTGEIGRIGEQMVADYLKHKGYIITRMNFRSDYGEIDIIAEKPDIVVFVEVKTRREDYLVSPADAVDSAKQTKIIKTAQVFLSKAYLFGSYRFDIAEVTYRNDQEGRPHFSLNYVKNAFYVNLEKD